MGTPARAVRVSCTWLRAITMDGASRAGRESRAHGQRLVRRGRRFARGFGAEGGTRTPTSCLTRPSNVRVCQFRHFGLNCQITSKANYSFAVSGSHGELLTSCRLVKQSSNSFAKRPEKPPALRTRPEKRPAL